MKGTGKLVNFLGNLDWWLLILVLGAVVFEQWRKASLLSYWLVDLLFAAGWLIGRTAAMADHVFYAYMCNPQELTCQRVRREVENKNWRNAWGLLKTTQGERRKLPISNILTGLVMGVMGVFVVTNGYSALATGLVMGLSAKLMANYWLDADKERWFWIFSKSLSGGEKSSLVSLWMGLGLWQVWKMII